MAQALGLTPNATKSAKSPLAAKTDLSPEPTEARRRSLLPAPGRTELPVQPRVGVVTVQPEGGSRESGSDVTLQQQEARGLRQNVDDLEDLVSQMISDKTRAMNSLERKMEEIEAMIGQAPTPNHPSGPSAGPGRQLGSGAGLEITSAPTPPALAVHPVRTAAKPRATSLRRGASVEVQVRQGKPGVAQLSPSPGPHHRVVPPATGLVPPFAGAPIAGWSPSPNVSYRVPLSVSPGGAGGPCSPGPRSPQRATPSPGLPTSPGAPRRLLWPTPQIQRDNPSSVRSGSVPRSIGRTASPQQGSGARFV